MMPRCDKCEYSEYRRMIRFGHDGMGYWCVMFKRDVSQSQFGMNSPKDCPLRMPENKKEDWQMKNQTEITKRIEAAEKELAAAKKELEKGGYEKPEEGVRYYHVTIDGGFVSVSWHTWDNDDIDNGHFESGNFFTSISDAQRVADMLRYFFLLQKKAREMGGLLGYGHDESDDEFVLFYSNFSLGVKQIDRLPQCPPLQPLLTRECAETLVKDPEIIAAAKKAWGVKE